MKSDKLLVVTSEFPVAENPRATFRSQLQPSEGKFEAKSEGGGGGKNRVCSVFDEESNGIGLGPEIENSHFFPCISTSDT